MPAGDLFEGGHAYAAPFVQAATASMDQGEIDYGAGLKIGYDLTRNFALDCYALKTGEDDDAIFKDGPAVTQAGIDAKLRQPFFNYFALTESAGLDCNIEQEKIFGHARIGLEAKATAHLGAFADVGIETDAHSFTRFPLRLGLTGTF